MFKNKLHRRLPVITAFMAVSIMAVGVAFAAWTANGEGTGEATATTADNLTIAEDGADSLYPNGSFDITVLITNPNPYNVSVTNIDLAVDEENSITAPGVCDSTGITWPEDGFDFVLDALVVGADNGTQSVLLEDALDIDNSFLDECQGATFTIDLVLTGASTAADPTP